MKFPKFPLNPFKAYYHLIKDAHEDVATGDYNEKQLKGKKWINLGASMPLTALGIGSTYRAIESFATDNIYSGMIFSIASLISFGAAGVYGMKAQTAAARLNEWEEGKESKEIAIKREVTLDDKINSISYMVNNKFNI
jgi:hypothetical protein